MGGAPPACPDESTTARRAALVIASRSIARSAAYSAAFGAARGSTRPGTGSSPAWNFRGTDLEGAVFPGEPPIVVTRQTPRDGGVVFTVTRGEHVTEVRIAVDGTALHVLIGASPRNTDGEDLVGQHFGERLVQQGVLPPAFQNRELPKDDDADRELQGPNVVPIRLQIVRPTNVGFQIWGKGDGVFQRASRAHLAEGIAEAIKLKIEKHYARADELFLLVDAVRFCAHATPEVIETFRATYPTLARDAGFREVWVVGPLADLVWRLDA